MSLGIAFKGPEGIVLAADSRVTLTALRQVQGQNLILPASFDNATKLLRVKAQQHVGAVTYGLGALGQQAPRTAHSFLPEFEAVIGSDRVSVADFSKRLSEFFMNQSQTHMPTIPPGQSIPDMVFLIGGYDKDAPYGRVFEVAIPSKPVPREWFPGAGEFGAVWGGQKEVVDRMIQGFDPRVLEIAQQEFSLPDDAKERFGEKLKTELTTPIPFPFLPLQDCVDLSIFLVRATIRLQTWTVGVRGVGGAIDVATITKTEGYKPIQQKEIAGERILY